MVRRACLASAFIAMLRVAAAGIPIGRRLVVARLGFAAPALVRMRGAGAVSARVPVAADTAALPVRLHRLALMTRRARGVVVSSHFEILVP